MTDRRAFVRTVAGALAAAAIPDAVLGCAAAPGRGAAPPERLGLQLYTVRGLMEQDVAGTLARVAEVGYREVEFAGYFDRDPAAVRAALADAGLAAPAAHIPLSALETDWERTLDAAGEIGHRYLVVAWMPEERRRTLDQYREVAELFNRAGERARASAIQFAYHNHDFEFAPIEGTVPYDVLLEATDPQVVQLELDLFWITKGGFDPLTYFARHPGRFPLVHVKDMDADGNMVDVGRGVIDFAGIFARREAAGIRHFFVEHDNPADPIASIRASLEHLRRAELWSDG